MLISHSIILAFFSELALFILIDLNFSTFSVFSDLAAFLFCTASGAKLSFIFVSEIVLRWIFILLAEFGCKK